MDFRRIYVSSSGDAWDLIREDGTGRLVRQAHAQSGVGRQQLAHRTRDFLCRNPYCAEHLALLNLIGTLLDGAAPHPD